MKNYLPSMTCCVVLLLSSCSRSDNLHRHENPENTSTPIHENSDNSSTDENVDTSAVATPAAHSDREPLTQPTSVATELPSPNPTPNVRVEENPVLSGPYFADVHRKILEPKCSACHSAENPAAGIDVTSYKKIIDASLVVPGEPKNSKLYEVCESGYMPKGGEKLKPDELKLLFDWIAAGAPDKPAATQTGERTPNPLPTVVSGAPNASRVPTPSAQPRIRTTPLPLLPTFKSIDINILQPKCTKCHSGPNAPHGIVTTSYRDLFNDALFPPFIIPGNPVQSSMYKAIASGRMPKNMPKLSKKEIDVVFIWIKTGARESDANAPDRATPTPERTPGREDRVPTPSPTAVPDSEPCDVTRLPSEPGFLPCPPTGSEPPDEPGEPRG